MSVKLILTGRIVATKGKQRVEIGAGTDISELPLPDKTYGLSAADVQRIVMAGCGRVVEDSPTDQASAPVPQERIDQLIAAIDQLEDGNEKHWTVENKPEVAALAAITGSKVSALERDAAWTAYTAM